MRPRREALLQRMIAPFALAAAAAAAFLLLLPAGAPPALVGASAFVPPPPAGRTRTPAGGGPAAARHRYGAATTPTAAARSTITTRRPSLCRMTLGGLGEAPEDVRAHPVPYPVGSRVVRLPSRGTRVRLFYPTTTAAAAAAASAAAEEGKEGRGGMAYAPYGTDGRSLGLAFLLAKASSGCVLDAPLAVNAGAAAGRNDTRTKEDGNNKLPLLIYSHGIGGNMDAATCLFRTVASRGAIVAAVEHTDGTASSTVRPDGSELEFSSYLMTGRQQLARRAQELLEVADVLPAELNGGFGAEEAGEGSSTGAGAEAGAVGPIVLGGHGYGAPSAVMAANGAPGGSDICGLILHDPALGMGYGMLPPNGADNRLPAITYVSDEYDRANVRYGARTVHVKGCRHGNFGDAPLWAPGPRLALLRPDPVQVHEQLAEGMADFLWTRDAASSAVAGGSLLEVVR